MIDINGTPVVLKPCPFCGFIPDPDEPDCIYPATRDFSVYQLVCYETGGGCSASVLGFNVQAVIEKWNKRT